MASEWAEVVFAYSRQDALRDGTFVDVTALAQTMHFACSVCMTRTIYSQIEHVLHPEDEIGQKEALRKLLGAAARALCKAFHEGEADRLLTCVNPLPMAQREVWIALEPNEDGSPGVTLLLPEDY